MASDHELHEGRPTLRGADGSLIGTVRSRWVAVAVFSIAVAIVALGSRFQPPLTRDISILRLPMGAIQGLSSPTVELLQRGGGGPQLGSIGLLFAVIAVWGGAYLIYRPRRLERALGVLLGSWITITAAASFNHPVLIQELDFQFEERQQLVRFIDETQPSAVTGADSGRARARSQLAGEPADLSHGPAFLVHGPLLLALMAGLYVAVAGGPPRTRVLHLIAWVLLGGVLAGAVCSRRLYAEYHWSEARRLETVGRFDEAAQRLESAVRALPAFDSLERTWILGGKIDHLLQRASPRERFYAAHQLALTNQIEKAVALSEMQLQLPPHEAGVAAQRNQLARLLELKGLRRWKQARYLEARAAFERSAAAERRRYGSMYFLGHIDVSILRAAPEIVGNDFRPILDDSADRALKADVLASLGDAHFRAGRIEEARQLYRESLRAFSLPKRINYRAQAGLVGM